MKITMIPACAGDTILTHKKRGKKGKQKKEKKEQKTKKMSE